MSELIGPGIDPEYRPAQGAWPASTSIIQPPMPEPAAQNLHEAPKGPDRGNGAARSPVLVAVGLVAIFGAACLAFIVSQRVPSRVFYDQELYPHPAIRQSVSQWPDFDFWHYESATTPGYHLLMAAVSKVISPSIVVLQVATLAISLALVGLLGFATARRTSPLLACVLCLPFVLCRYVVDSGAWLLPDNIAWLGVLAVLLVALRPRVTGRALILGGAVLLALVFVRQIHIWSAGLLWGAAYLQPARGAAPGGEEPTLREALFGNIWARLGRAMLAVAATVPAWALVALFIRYWGGAVPPVFRQWYHSYNPSAVVFILALFGIWGAFFAATWVPHVVRAWRTARGWLVGSMLVALVVGIAVPTNDFEAAKHTGLWGIAERFPVVGHTSTVMLGQMVLGALSLAGFLFAIPIRQRLVFLAAV